MRTSPRRRFPDNLRAIGTSGNIMDSEKAQTLDQNTRGKLAEKMVVRTCAKLKKNA
jgi:hypothetical protein